MRRWNKAAWRPSRRVRPNVVAIGGITAMQKSRQTTMQAHVPALSSAKKIIDYICASAEPRGISDIAQHVHLPKSSVHRICWALVDLDILSDAGNAFQLGYTVREWANAFDRQT